VSDEIRAGMIEFLPRLRRFACALTGDLDKGDDLVQETCLRALSRAELWQPGTRLDSWMFRIAQNIWFDRLRAGKVRGEQIDVDALDIHGEDGRAVVDCRLTLESVREGIGRLPPEQQVLIALVCIDGRSYKETARIVDVPIGTVMSRLARARRSLHDWVNREKDAGTPATEERRGRNH
jgi:RNA polymerase sigma-70 factor, ECF subfamily